ncbi:DNA starvation/stationary phase protection protein [Hymenobacter sp. BT186]|uniref:DNA starvation/stationary phase protection protein n=1 Tax=Hymenobacter telluris TaxID=2816474 RepID=A0A939J8V1_9BACT|nr:DNA starvation/stationary phase protection protein [Hymenobacter telluris]MBO0358149.1 DNA starvation/stationary phase protection protein [Hymenobacter telluris]MBW3374176.1 DNA starvation/stationary phase protection protein [Hymenobacter norwichensis]
MAKAPAKKDSAAPVATPKPSAASKKAASSNGQASSNGHATPSVQPVLNQQFDAPAPLQKYGTVSQRLPIGLDTKARQQSVNNLNQLLADTITLRDLYKKHHWQVVGPTFYQLHLLYDKHYEEQSGLVDTIAERIQILGGVAVAMAHDVAELTSIPRPPRDREEAPVQVSRLLEAHQIILKNCHDYAKQADESGDDGTNDVVVSDVMRTNELQVWFVSEHVVDSPLVRAE